MNVEESRHTIRRKPEVVRSDQPRAKQQQQQLVFPIDDVIAFAAVDVVVLVIADIVMLSMLLWLQLISVCPCSRCCCCCSCY